MKNDLKVGLVIPFYQRQPGLLAACLASVVSQSGFEKCHVVVVDDDSPIPAKTEMSRYLESYPNIVLVEQKNGGPSAARNKGLDSLPVGVEVVTFLDSDDAWNSGYLDNVLAAFNRGCDVYFANAIRYSSSETRFDWDHASGRQLVVSEHEPVMGAEAMYVFQGDFFDFVLDRTSIIGPSTFAYSYIRHSRVRFQRELRWGEDRYFKLEVVKNSEKILFSTSVNAVEGKGVNIFDSAQWGSVQGLDLLLAHLQMTKKILKEFSLSRDQENLVRNQLRKYRHDFSVTVVHLLRSGIMPPVSVWRGAANVDPAVLVLFFPILAQAALGRLTKGSK